MKEKSISNLLTCLGYKRFALWPYSVYKNWKSKPGSRLHFQIWTTKKHMHVIIITLSVVISDLTKQHSHRKKIKNKNKLPLMSWITSFHSYILYCSCKVEHCRKLFFPVKSLYIEYIGDIHLLLIFNSSQWGCWRRAN